MAEFVIPTKGYGAFSLPVLGVGTASGGRSLDDWKRDADKTVEGIRAALRLGYTHIDTAERYGQGFAELLVGHAIKGFDRKNLFIVTKALPQNLRYRSLISSCEESLKRLGISYVDLYMIHEPNPNIPLRETLEAMGILKKRGLARFIGVSKFAVKELRELEGLSEFRIVNNQISYRLDDREVEKNGTLDYCREHNILVTAYRPLGRGTLSASGGNRVLDEIAEKYGITTAQIAIHWLISKPNIVTIVRSSSAEHLKENLGALNCALDPEGYERLEKS